MTDVAPARKPACAAAPAGLGGLAAPTELTRHLEQHRRGLHGYCYRMLGSAFEAEDAVQETMVRAWRSLDGFEGRAALRSWLYRIATNVCLDLLSGRRRRARPMDLSPASRADGPLGEPLPEQTWIQPVPDGLVLAPGGDPAELAVARESIRLAFIAALQFLPPRQRAVLILRDVLRWKAAEVAELVGATVVSVNSVLQRARATLAASDLTATGGGDVGDEAQQRLLARYLDAFERFDVESLVSLLHEEAVASMPPHEQWLRGRGELRRWYLGEGSACRGSRLVPTAANGLPAFGLYRPSAAGGHEAFGLQVLELAGGLISGVHTFLDPRLFRCFELPLRLDAQPSPAPATVLSASPPVA